jgi:hypothetical protein
MIMGRFIIKHINNMKPQKKNPSGQENNISENKSVMTTEEKIAMAQAALGVEAAPIKRVKKDKGHIERTESSKTILTEDNKELLND